MNVMDHKVQFVLLLALFAFAIGITKCEDLFACKTLLGIRSSSDTGEEDCDADFVIDNSILPDVTECGVSAAISPITEFPWTAILENANFGLICNGALINRRYVISAANCLLGRRAVDQVKTVKLGDYNTATDPDCEEEICKNSLQRIPVEKIIIHESFNLSQNLNNNIGLIRLESGARITKSVSPICLPSVAQDFSALNTETIITMSGWGATISRGPVPDVKQNIDEERFKTAKCTEFFEWLKISSDSFFCTKPVGSTAPCRGFSGAILVQKHGNNWFAVGSTAYRVECGFYVNMNIPYYDEWIRSKLEM